MSDVEPVQVSTLNSGLRDADAEYGRLRSDVAGMPAETVDQARGIALRVAVRAKAMAPATRQALLVALLIDHLTGVSDEPVVSMPPSVRNALLAART